MKNVFRDIEENFQMKELFISFLLTGLFLFLGLMSHSRLATVQIVDPSSGVKFTIHAEFYGYPFEMVRELTPIGSYEFSLWGLASEIGFTQILWGGLVLDFALYFLLAFAIVYLVKKVSNHFLESEMVFFEVI